jgi:hypothetical protein
VDGAWILFLRNFYFFNRAQLQPPMAGASLNGKARDLTPNSDFDFLIQPRPQPLRISGTGDELKYVLYESQPAPAMILRIHV